MEILIAPDKFKGSLSASEVCQAIEKGLNSQKRNFEISTHPMADGGDGSLSVLANYLQLTKQDILTVDPIGREISAIYFTAENAAFIEVASASGLVLLSKKEQNPLKTSTIGTGIMIADALAKGYQQIYLFLGGSATNDAGMGIASALGCQFLDEQKNVLKPVGGNLLHVKQIEYSPHFDFTKIKIVLLCDVTNPLFGSTGAAHVYAAQKGAKPEEIEYLDDGLRNFSRTIHQQMGINISSLPGSGAAGGIGAGLVALYGAKIEMGFDVIAKLTGLENRIQNADWIISGEGKLDEQSLQGKVIDGVARLCRKHTKPLTLFVGKNDLSTHETALLRATSIFSVSEHALNMEDAMSNGAKYLEQIAESCTFSENSLKD